MICRIILFLLISFSVSAQDTARFQFQDGNVRDTLKKSLLDFYQVHAGINESKREILSSIISEKLKFAEAHLPLFFYEIRSKTDSSFLFTKINELKKFNEISSTSRSEKFEREKLLLQICVIKPTSSLPYFIEWLNSIQQIPAFDDVQEKMQHSEQYALFQIFLYRICIEKLQRYKSNNVVPYVYNSGLAYYNHGARLINEYKASHNVDAEKLNQEQMVLQATVKRWFQKALPYLKYAEMHGMTLPKISPVRKEPSKH